MTNTATALDAGSTVQVLGHGRTTSAESFWYLLGCIAFGAYYFAKVPIKKALSEYGLVQMTRWESFWYIVQNIAFGSGYLAKSIAKKALAEVPPTTAHLKSSPPKDS